jgi:hypothetical protein
MLILKYKLIRSISLSMLGFLLELWVGGLSSRGKIQGEGTRGGRGLEDFFVEPIWQ